MRRKVAFPLNRCGSGCESRRSNGESAPERSERRHFNSTVQYAVSRNCFHELYRSSARRMLITGLRFGFTGLVIKCRCACSGVRPPFFTLHFTQQQTMFSHVLLPPWLLGTT